MSGSMAREDLTLAEVVSTDFVRCRHCFDVYKQPMLLPCLHTLCRQCVVDIIVAGARVPAEAEVVAPGPKSTPLTGVVPPHATSPRERRSSDWEIGLSTNGKVQLRLVCPMCQASLALTSDADHEGDIHNENGGNFPDRGTRVVQSCKTSNKKNRDLEKKHDNEDNNRKRLTTAEEARVLVDGVVDASLAPNYFLRSMTQLHRFKRQDSRLCLYCQSDGQTVPAVSLCLECQDDLCDACANAHRKTRVTRDHTVATHASVRQGLFDHDIRQQNFIPCHDHGRNQFSHFCLDCLVTACQQCSSRNHYDHAMVTLEDALANFLPEIQQIQNAVSRRALSLKYYIQFLNEETVQLQENKSAVTFKINSQADYLHKMIEDYRQHSVARLEQACADENTNLGLKIQTITTAATALDDAATFVLYLSSLGRQDEVLSAYSSILARHRQLLNTATDAMTTRLAPAFTPGPATQPNVQMLVGQLELLHVPLGKEDAPQTRLTISTLMPNVLRPPQLKLTFQAASPLDTRTVYPSGIALNRKMLAVVDRENAKVKIFDHSGKLRIDFRGEKNNQLVKPFDAVFLRNGALAVTDSEGGAVRVFDCTGKFLTNLQGEIRHPRGVALNRRGDIIVLDGHLRHLTVHDAVNGAMITKIIPRYTKKIDGDKCDVLIDPHYVTVGDDDRIFITDMASPNLKILSASGQVLATSMDYGIGEQESLHPSGLCVDKFGQILVADTNNSRIHLGLPNGQTGTALLTQKDGISTPVSLCLNHDEHLVLAQSGGEIRVLKYL